MRHSKPSLVNVVEAQCGKPVEILLRGGKKVRGILEEIEPDMSVYLTHMVSLDENNQKNKEKDHMNCTNNKVLYIRARQILFFHFLKDVAVVANTESWHRRKVSLEQARPVRKLPKAKSKDGEVAYESS
ncbi:hypothetical protein Gasu2_17850 [Galdieria sulphuraria]|uniref:Sm domain-containing protein n=1 Tax=Galdieria sulphuraria TaxID=130081 RepID=M2XCK8_GALSU|nr:uncharacterized protein Gasu_48250 [Galdieria sulphuraria]EME27682.1 hypothetical protein Gasu_48250 [Galdieria sulphuraria]GJD07423.1 hypothetical protein Gasu2_17850 [Galdieria sulphuraria]|eukprot:XP_005704202.1 hypothetical protein Gasu_48250 [Galdieria sulphuraria]